MLVFKQLFTFLKRAFPLGWSSSIQLNSRILIEKPPGWWSQLEKSILTKSQFDKARIPPAFPFYGLPQNKLKCLSLEGFPG
jgi:hypothetical protein